MSTYKLTYFNGRGLAETSRLIFAASGQQYEDIRIERDQWAALKPQTPLGQVPVLEVDGVKIPQSVAIARFLAKRLKLAGKDDLEQAKADVVIDTIQDLFHAFIPIIRTQDEQQKKELTEKFVGEELPKHLKNLETLGKLYGNGGQFFVGNNLTWADLMFHEFGQKVLTFDANCLNNFPWLQANRAAVEQQPRIAEYLKNRPKTEF